MTQQLTEHFNLDELTRSQTAVRRGIDNTPSNAVVQNLTRVAGVLEQVRIILNGRAISISSGYRCPGLNAAVGGARDSRHLLGLAADFTCPDFGAPQKICVTLQRGSLVFDQLIFEGTWVHIGLAPTGEPPRHQILTARFTNGPTEYLPGIVT